MLVLIYKQWRWWKWCKWWTTIGSRSSGCRKWHIAYWHIELENTVYYIRSNRWNWQTCSFSRTIGPASQMFRCSACFMYGVAFLSSSKSTQQLPLGLTASLEWTHNTFSLLTCQIPQLGQRPWASYSDALPTRLVSVLDVNGSGVKLEL